MTSRIRKRQGNGSSFQPSARQHCDGTPKTHFRTLTPRRVSYICAVLSHEVCGHLLHQQQETNTPPVSIPGPLLQEVSPGHASPCVVPRVPPPLPWVGGAWTWG